MSGGDESEAAAVAVEPDALTRAFVPVQVLRPEGEFHAFVHHDHRVSHDLPETGGAK